MSVMLLAPIRECQQEGTSRRKLCVLARELQMLFNDHCTPWRTEALSCAGYVSFLYDMWGPEMTYPLKVTKMQREAGFQKCIMVD